MTIRNLTRVKPNLRRDSNGVALPPTDGELLMRFARHSDEGAFAEIVQRHGPLVWLVCNRILRHRQDVEDAFQATFVILAQRAAAIRANDSASSWLFKVAQRTAMAARRKRSRRREESLAVDPPQGEEALPLLQDRQFQYALFEELRRLPSRYQTAIVLRYLEGQSRRAIADQTDSTVGQIQGRLARGRRLLRARLARQGVSLSIAAGSVSIASSSAAAAVTPSFVSATAATCVAMKSTGAAVGVSPAALQLAKEGIKAMWCASILKAGLVATSALIVTAAVWAAPGNGDQGQTGATADVASASVELVAAAEKPEAASEAPARGVEVSEQNVPQSSAQEERAKNLQKAISQQEELVEALIDEKARSSAALEREKLETWLLQREVEQLHEKLISLIVSPVRTDEHKVQVQQLNQQVDEAKDKLRDGLSGNSQTSAEAARIEFKTSLEQGRLQELMRLSVASEFGVADRASAEAPMLQLTREARPIPRRLDDKIEPFDVIRVSVANPYPNAPVDSEYPIEPMGTVALGPVYGRVKVVGMSVLEAETAIKKHLSEMIENPQVQVTMYEKSEVTPTRTSQAQIPGESRAATFSRDPRLSEQPFETAVLQQLEKLRDEIGRINSDNSSLRKRLDEIKSQEAGR